MISVIKNAVRDKDAAYCNRQIIKITKIKQITVQTKNDPDDKSQLLQITIQQ
jgi:hypothetical protein